MLIRAAVPTVLCSALLLACNNEKACTAPKSFDAARLTIEWQWTAGEVASTPLVADLDADGAPELIVNVTHLDGHDWKLGEIAVLDGGTGELRWRIQHAPDEQRFGSHGRSTPGVADVDGDGKPDIIYAGREQNAHGRTSQLHAVDHAGKLLWSSHHADGEPAYVMVDNGAPTLANLDADPGAEIVIGAAILDDDGLLVWDQDGDGGGFGSPITNDAAPKSLYPGALSAVVDLDADGAPEIVSGREAWKLAWTPGDPPKVSLSLLWRDTSGDGGDGWPAVADLDADGDPEVVLTAWPDIKVLDGRTGQPWCGVDPSGAACEKDPASSTRPVRIKGSNLGGPPTIADFDGDGRPEVGVAGGQAYAVYDFNRPDEQLHHPASDPAPRPGAMFVRWSLQTQDNSSAATVGSVFDFDDDGLPELLYQDECYFRIIAGATGAPLVELANSSNTGHEYPVVADLDGDGETEIVVVANIPETYASAACLARDPAHKVRQGVHVYGPGEQNWVRAVPHWTQHTFHGSDADPAGNPPLAETSHWLTPAQNGWHIGIADPAPCE